MLEKNFIFKKRKEILTKKGIILILLGFVFLFSFSGILNETRAVTISIRNPLTYNTFEELILRIVRFLQMVAMTITALVIVISGYYFVTSAGDPQQLVQARKMGLYALIGLLIILIAQGIIELLKQIIGVI